MARRGLTRKQRKIRRMKECAGAFAVFFLSFSFMLVLWYMSPTSDEIAAAAARQDRGILMERYQAEQAADLREEEMLQKHSPCTGDKPSLSEESEEILLKIAMAEAEGEDVEGKALVMRVVLNRIRDTEFPNTVLEVVFQVGQFQPITDGRYYDMEPDEGCYQALKMVEAGWDGSMGSTYFRTAVPEKTWHSENLKLLFVHGNHAFFAEEEET